MTDPSGFNKIFFHMSTTGNRTGWGDLVRACDAAGVPVSVHTVGGEGMGDIVAQWDEGSIVPHVPVVRYMPLDGSQDVPPYGAPIIPAALNWWNFQKSRMSNDVIRYHNRVVIKHGNELDKNHANWLGEFFTEVATLAINDPDGPFISAPFGWASGEPEREHWLTPGMQKYLRFCNENPNYGWICVHEYSYNVNDIWDRSPYLVGRFKMLFDVCDGLDLRRPNVVIHEFGWVLNDIPPTSIAMAQIDQVAREYAWYPEIKGAGIWTTKIYQNNIHDKVAALIPHVQAMTINNRYPIGPSDPVDPPPVEPPEDAVNGLRLDDWKQPIEDSDYRINQEIWFKFRYENVLTHPVRYGGMGALITRWDGEKEVLHYYQHSYNGNLNPGYGPGTDLGWRDRWVPNDVGVFAMYPYLTFDPDATDKRSRPETILDGHVMGDPYWFEVGSLTEPGGPINPPDPEPPVEPPVGLHKVVVVKIAQEHTKHEWELIGGMAHDDSKRTQTASHDDAESMYLEGNEESYIRVIDPGLPSQASAIEYFERQGYEYEVVYRFTDPDPDPVEFKYEAWPTIEHRITQVFGNNPEYYAQFGFPGHEGIDIASPYGTAYYAPAGGVITRNRNTRSDGTPTAYGRHIIIDHQNGYTTLLAHMQEDPPVVLGQTVVTGQLVGYSGNTGISFGPHEHLTLKKEGYVHPGWEDKPGYIDPASFLMHLYNPVSPPVDPPPGTGPIIDLVGYLMPSSQRPRLYEVETKVSGRSIGQQRHQSHRDGMGNEFYHTKGGDGPDHSAEWEQFRLSGDMIQRYTDTSMGSQMYYTLTTQGAGLPFVNWLKRYMRAGEVFISRPAVTAYMKANCAVASGPTNTTDYLKFVKVHPTLECYNGIVVHDVIEVHWSKTPDFSRVEETYFYSRDPRAEGLVGWGNSRDGRWAFVSELHEAGARPNSVRESGCFSAEV